MILSFINSSVSKSVQGLKYVGECLKEVVICAKIIVIGIYYSIAMYIFRHERP